MAKTSSLFDTFTDDVDVKKEDAKAKRKAVKEGRSGYSSKAKPKPEAEKPKAEKPKATKTTPTRKVKLTNTKTRKQILDAKEKAKKVERRGKAVKANKANRANRANKATKKPVKVSRWRQLLRIGKATVKRSAPALAVTAGVAAASGKSKRSKSPHSRSLAEAQRRAAKNTESLKIKPKKEKASPAPKRSKFGKGNAKTIKHKGRSMANVTAEQLKASGHKSLTAYMNAWNRSGKRP